MMSQFANAVQIAPPRVAIVRLPHISNFTDFRLLPDARYISQPIQERFDVIFLPGTKNTIEDMHLASIHGIGRLAVAAISRWRNDRRRLRRLSNAGR